MPLRIYIAPQIGNGSGDVWNYMVWTDSTGPYRSLLCKYVQEGEDFEELDTPARKVSLCVLDASAATHDAIDADSRITPIIPLRATDRTHLGQILSTPFSSYPLAWRNAAKAKLEGWGVDTAWIGGSHTMRDLIRYVLKMFSVGQIASGQGQSHVIDFLKNNLDTQVSSLSAAQRQAAANWLTSKGVDVSWIQPTTTVREVVTSLPSNLAKLYGRNVPLMFMGEDANG